MKTLILYCPITKSEHLICLDQVIYLYEITFGRYKGHIEIRFEDGSTQIYKANYLDVAEAFISKGWFSSIINSLIWIFKSKRKK
jgi:hypothetical protein